MTFYFYFSRNNAVISQLFTWFRIERVYWVITLFSGSKFIMHVEEIQQSEISEAARKY